VTARAVWLVKSLKLKLKKVPLALLVVIVELHALLERVFFIGEVELKQGPAHLNAEGPVLKRDRELFEADQRAEF